ncbi:MAG: hypothetical protein NT164_05455 [Verrucomicrobiae bacterium]|nr:hypothetical protein [Verrucomicrobiae bacterium]
MISLRISFLSLLLAIALTVTSCSNLTPGENAAIAAGVVGTAAGVALGASGVNPGITIPVAIGGAVLAGAGAYVYTKQRATVDQRRIAEARARLYYAELNQQQQNHSGRYLAVNAPNTVQTKGQSVMLYDTQTGATSQEVYDVKKVPAVGSSTSLGNTSATYIGSGN